MTFDLFFLFCFLIKLMPRLSDRYVHYFVQRRQAGYKNSFHSINEQNALGAEIK